VINAAVTVDKLAELRAAFDQTYAIPPFIQNMGETEDLLAIRLAGKPYALRTAEISAFARIPNLVAVPSPSPELRGLAGVRGAVAPIYSLTALFGADREEQLRWCVWCGSEELIGFAFGEFENFVRVSPSQVYAAEREDLTFEHVKSVFRVDEIVRPIVNLSSIVQMMKRRGAKNPDNNQEEQQHVDIR
jgi:chemotaxis signal transduction protein